MNDDALLRELRAEIHQLGPSSPSRRYPVALKARIVKWSGGRLTCPPLLQGAQAA